MYYAMHARLVARRDASHFMYLEPDVVPLRARWAEALHALLPPRSERFWVKGSAARGPTRVDEWVTHHINGNALYDCGDAEFARLVAAAETNPPRVFKGRSDPYDLALAAHFYDVTCHALGDANKRCEPLTSVAWRRDRQHLYKYAEFVVNYHDAVVDLAEARRRYPCAVLVPAPAFCGSRRF